MHCPLSDNEPPKMRNCPTDQTKETALGQSTAMVVWEPTKATDNSGEEVSVVCVPSTGTNFTVGQTEVECYAVDSSGNEATCRFRVSVNGMYVFYHDKYQK